MKVSKEDIIKTKISNLESPKSGRPVANQFEVLGIDKYGNSFRIFQSYNSVIVYISGGNVYLDKHYWNYSNTTTKYRNIFLGETTQETKRKIKSGEYTLTDLN